MKRKFNDFRIKNKSNLNMAGKFFIQRILEILDPKTIHAYSIKYLNSHIALQELLDVCDKTMNNVFKHDHFNPVVNEVRSIILKDSILNKYAPSYKKVILSSLDITNKDKNLLYNRIKYHIKHALNHLDTNYLDWLISEISYCIEHNDVEKLNHICEAFISELHNYLGWSAEGINKEVYKLFENNDYTFEQFFAILRKQRENYVCLYKLQHKDSFTEDLNNVFKKVNIEVKKGLDIIESYNIEDLTNKLKENEFYIIEEACSYDYFSAIDLSWEKLVKKFDILSFYGYKIPELIMAPYSFIPNVNLVIHSRNVSLFDEKPQNEAPVDLLEQFININKEHSLPITKIKRTFEFIRMSKESLSNETKFLNQWVALESFVKSNQYSSIIVNIYNVVPNVIFTRNIYRLLRDFYSMCRKCGIVFPIQDDDTYNKKVEYLLKTLLDEQRSQELINQCENTNILLGVRCKELSDLFKNPEKVKETIKGYCMKIEWQLQRLYRVRNSQVHSGETNQNILLFYNHLNHYLNNLLSEVIYKLNNNKYDTIDEIFSAMKDNYNATIDVLDSIKPKDNVESYVKLLLNGALF